MGFRESAEKNEKYIIEQRRYFHQYPELSFEEKKTTEEIGHQLSSMGIEPHYFEGYYGVWALIEGKKAGPGSKTVVLRADIDALPVMEKTGLPFASRNPGVMHACGHDNHIAMLLGAAKILTEQREELKGNVKLLFQSAEESCHGAEYYVQNGFFDDVDAVYGAHVSGNLDAPLINVEAGPRMASCDNFTITVRGKSAHGSAPQYGVDAIVAAASIILQIQTLVSRKNDPRNPLVVTIGEIAGGQRFNIIANEVVMKGTVRTHSREVRGQIEGWIRQVIRGVALSFDAEAELDYEYYPAPLVNDGKLAEIARNAVKSLYGEEALGELEVDMGSEDFSYFLDRVPGVYAFIGTRNEKKGLTAKNHNDHYDVDESALKRGAALYAQFAFDFLKES